MGIEAAPNLTLVQALYADGADAYRRAVAASVEGTNPDEHWGRWEQDTAALLLISWATGATISLQAIGLAPNAKPIRFDRLSEDVALSFEAGPAREVVRRFINTMPITRAQWDRLLLVARGSARELRVDEQANALREIAKRSPNLAALLGLADQGNKPREVPGQEPPVYVYPPAVIRHSPAPVYVERSIAPAESVPSRGQSDWYYCAGSQTYYPYAKECPGGWQRVPAQPSSR